MEPCEDCPTPATCAREGCGRILKQRWDAAAPAGGEGHPEFLAMLTEIRLLHQEKSGGYGTGSDPFANFTRISALTGRARYAYPIERMVEKLARCLSLIEQGRTGELGEEFKDVSSLALCAEAMRREDEGR
jgi:hypothetical protein